MTTTVAPAPARSTNRAAKIADRLDGGLGPGGVKTLYLLGAISVAKALALIVFAEAVAQGIVGVIAGSAGWQTAVSWAVGAALARALLSWLGAITAERCATGAKQAIRAQLADRMMEPGTTNVGSATALVTHDLDELDEYYGSVLPALTNAAAIPLLIGARILFADWISAAVIVITVPLIPLFMVLVGQHTRERVSEASRALGRLSDHLVELAKGLPVLVGLGRVEEQTASLEKISDEYRSTTMVTLRTAFLSSLVLELISTISVAVVAVFVGLRLLNGSLTLEVGLLVLILAPECYAPFRELGSAFHASQNGLGALARARAILGRTPTSTLTVEGTNPAANALVGGRSDAPRVSPTTTDAAVPADNTSVLVRGLTVRYSDRDIPAICDAWFRVVDKEVTALVGPSGSGKSTILEVLAGRLAGAEVLGEVSGVDPAHIAWVPQHPVTVADTVRGELELYGDGIPVSLLSSRIAEVARRLDLTSVVDSDPARLSPGELRRVAVARALLRVDAGAELVLLDEPTAHLDASNARAVESEIAALRGRVAVLLASHDPSTVALATRRIPLSASGVVGLAAVSRDPSVRAAGDGPAPSPARACLREPTPEDTRAQAPAPSPGGGAAARLGDSKSVARGRRSGEHRPAAALARFLRPSLGRYALAAVLGVFSALFGAALIAVSGWLIVRASEGPAIMFLLVAIVGVRFFGVGRSVLAYGQQLLTHDAIFASIGRLRIGLWSTIARRGTASRALLRPGNTVDYLVITVDRIRDLAPRVVIPVAVGILMAVASIITVALLHAPALGLLIAYLLVCLVAAPIIALAADKRASRQQATLRSDISRRFAALIAAADDLRANGVDGRVRGNLTDADRSATRAAARSTWASGAGHALVVFASCATAAMMLAVAAPAVHAGTLPPAIIAVLALLPLGMMEPLRTVVDAAQLWPTLAGSLRQSDEILAEDDRDTVPARPRAGVRISPAPLLPAAPAPGRPIRQLELAEVSARWPGTSELVFEPVSASVTRGDWLVVQGPSGTGKSTLISLLLGYLTPASGRYLVNGTRMNGSDVDSVNTNHANADDTRSAATAQELVDDARLLRTHLAWAPQDAHMFDSTIRGNLLLARGHDDAPTELDMIEALAQVGLGAFFASLREGLDTRVGPEGSNLSGGQRQRLAVARALLTTADVVLLDEPTAHLDRQAAEALIRDLRKATAGRITVLVTHHADDLRATDMLLQLGTPGATTSRLMSSSKVATWDGDNGEKDSATTRPTISVPA